MHRRRRRDKRVAPAGVGIVFAALAFLVSASPSRAIDTPYGYPSNGVTAAKSGVIQAGGPVFMHGCLLYNAGAGTDFVQFFDSATVPADGTKPAVAPIPLTAGQGQGWGTERQFNNGVSWACSSTAATKTLCGAADILISCQYN